MTDTPYFFRRNRDLLLAPYWRVVYKSRYKLDRQSVSVTSAAVRKDCGAPAGPGEARRPYTSSNKVGECRVVGWYGIGSTNDEVAYIGGSG
jgi:hypothetical protein